MRVFARQAGSGGSPAKLQHSLGDLDAARRVLSKAERVQHLVDEDRFHVPGVVSVLLHEAITTDEDLPASDRGHGQGRGVLATALDKAVSEEEEAQVPSRRLPERC